MKPSHGGFGNFFPIGTYAGIGTTCVEFENVIKSAMKKKKYWCYIAKGDYFYIEKEYI